MLVVFIVTVIYSLRRVKLKEIDSCCKIGTYCSAIWARISIYGSIITHLADTATDFASVAEFYIVAKEFTPQECGHFDVYYCFLVSVAKTKDKRQKTKAKQNKYRCEQICQFHICDAQIGQL
jgi:hypothetical protein